MGDPAEPTDLERFIAHLLRVAGPGTARAARKHNATPTCPICSNNSWFVRSPVAALHYVMASRDVAISGEPMIQVSCKQCHYVMHFMWDPIVETPIDPEILAWIRSRAAENGDGE